ncbi:MAG: hypothetical protein K2X45_00085 [Phreatobacter sp.]|nr:hypothetical protein [Phreatobacter sp.]
MFSFFDTRSPTQRFADEAMEQLSSLARRIGREGSHVQSAMESAPDHIRAAARGLDRMGVGPQAAAVVGQQALRHVGRHPASLMPLVIVGAAIAVGYWLAQPGKAPSAAAAKSEG